MPNWAFNTVTFEPKDVQRVKDLMTTPNSLFDFNALIPMPDSLAILSGSVSHDVERLLKGEDLERLKELYPDKGDTPDPSIFYGGNRIPVTMPELRVFAGIIQSNLEQYGAPDWYEWRYKNWGTKWNASNVEWDENSLHIDTAWAPPVPVFLELSKRLSIRFVARCEEELFNYGCIMTYCNGEVIEDQYGEGPEGLRILGWSEEEIEEVFDCSHAVEEVPAQEEEHGKCA